MKTGKIFFRYLLLIIIILTIFHQTLLYAELFDCTREVPIFDHRAEGNRLPYGDYVMIRSFRDITQIIIRSDTYKTIVYTDHNNMLEGEITATAFSEFDMTVSYPAVPSQEEFNRMLNRYLMEVYSANRMNIFSGMKSFNEKIKNRNYKLENFSDEFKIKLTDTDTDKEIILDVRWKKIIVRTVKGGGEAARCPSVYVDQTQDRNIRKIIYNYAELLKQSRKK